jgi:four helix bundle protein
MGGVEDLKVRTKRFALDVIRFCAVLPQSPESRVIGRQLIRSASSVGANYRAACRARSKADFINKLAIVEEEADESSYWLELLEELGIRCGSGLQRLQDEAGQLVAIFVSSKKTAKKK